MTRDDGDDENYAGQQVRITGRNKSYIATTDKDGVYEIYDLPPGRYTIEPVLQQGWKIDEWLITRDQTRAEWKRSQRNLPPLTKRWFTLRAKKHFGADISLVLANRIAGRVTTATGEPLNRVCVSLVSPGDTDTPECLETGSSIRQLSPGENIIGAGGDAGNLNSKVLFSLASTSRCGVRS